MSSANTQAEEKYEYSTFAIPGNTINVKYYNDQLRELARDGWEIYATDVSCSPLGCSVYFIRRAKKGGFAMKKTVYDCSALAGKLEGWSSLSAVKASMLEAIANIAVAVSDKDADKALDIQCELMWMFEVLNTIEEVEQ